MEKSFDVVIIGSGIGGLSIAHLLGARNIKTALIDGKNDPAGVGFDTLGSFLDLERFGLPESIVAAKQSEVIFHSPHLAVKKKGKAYIVNKHKLYKELLNKAVDNKVAVFPSTYINGFALDKKGMVGSVTDEKGNKFHAGIFVDATGVAGFFSKRFGLQDKNLNIAQGLEYNVKYLDPQFRTHLFFGKLFKGGYGWIFPFGNDRAIFGFGSFDPSVKTTLRQRFNELFDNPQIRQLVLRDNDRLSGGTIPVDVKTKFVHKNVVCVGDSVSQVNPMVGEGHRFILDAGQMAARAVSDALKEHNLMLLHRYEDDWKEKYYRDYRLSKKGQVFANKLSQNNLLSDLAAIYLASKSDSTFIDLIAGHITPRSIFLP